MESNDAYDVADNSGDSTSTSDDKSEDNDEDSGSVETDKATSSSVFDQSVDSFKLKEFFVMVNAQIFAVVFWFVIFGPWGAVFYRFTQLLANEAITEGAVDYAASAEKLMAIFDWIPARLFSFSFALVGNFIAVLPVWMKHAFKDMVKLDRGEDMIADCAHAALGKDAHEDHASAVALVDRSLIAWLVVLALIVLL